MRGYHVAAQGRLGHARPAGRGRGREGARASTARPRSRRTASSRSSRSASTPCSATPTSGRSSPSASASGSTSPTPTSRTTRATSRACGGRSPSCFKKGLLYQGHKVVWWWAQGGTALSAAEVGLGYKTVDDPSASSSRSRSSDEPDTRARSSWTTTPVDAAVEHVRGGATRRSTTSVVDAGDPQARRRRGAARRRSRKKLKKELRRCVATSSRAATLGRRALRAAVRRYSQATRRRRRCAKDGAPTPYWRVIAADFVTLDAGTGIVHIAPAFGEDDFQAHRKRSRRGSARRRAALRGEARRHVHPRDWRTYAGRWVKEADKDSSTSSKERGLLVHAESIATSIRSAGAPTTTR